MQFTLFKKQNNNNKNGALALSFESTTVNSLLVCGNTECEKGAKVTIWNDFYKIECL